jgi:hypothetical protein
MPTVANMTRPTERVVLSYSQRGTTKQSFKEEENADDRTRLSRHRLVANAVWLQLGTLAHAIADKIGEIRHGAESARIDAVYRDAKSVLKRDKDLGKVEAIDTQIIL